MIRFMHGNLFESKAEALVNTVNCVGVMGKGIAYQFRRAYPAMFHDYESRCKRGEVRLGEVTHFREKDRLIINFPTKGHWRSQSSLTDIHSGLVSLRTLLEKEQIHSIALPPLGCGNGGLHWPDVKQAIIEALGPLSAVDVEVYEPAGKFETAGKFESEVAQKPRLSLSHYVLTALRLELHSHKKLDMQKAAYFFNVYHGAEYPKEASYFRFIHHKFGPYCADLDRLLLTVKDALDHTGMTVKELLEDGIHQRLSGADADRLRLMLPAVQQAADLCNAESSQIEALATVHAVIGEGGLMTDAKIVEQFMSWSPEKAQRFGEEDVLRALAALEKWDLVTRSLLGYTLPTRMDNRPPERKRPSARGTRVRAIA